MLLAAQTYLIRLQRNSSHLISLAFSCRRRISSSLRCALASFLFPASAEFRAYDRCARSQRFEFCECDLARQRHHPAIRAWIEFLGRDELHGRTYCARNLFRLLYFLSSDVDGADHHVLAFEQADQFERHFRVMALEGHLIDRRAREQRKGAFILAPLGPERFLPVDIRLDAVAVTDVNGRLAFQTIRCALQGVDSPRLDVV